MAAIQGMGLLGGGKKDAWIGNFSPISDKEQHDMPIKP